MNLIEWKKNYNKYFYYVYKNSPKCVQKEIMMEKKAQGFVIAYEKNKGNLSAEAVKFWNCLPDESVTVGRK